MRGDKEESFRSCLENCVEETRIELGKERNGAVKKKKEKSDWKGFTRLQIYWLPRNFSVVLLPARFKLDQASNRKLAIKDKL